LEEYAHVEKGLAPLVLEDMLALEGATTVSVEDGPRRPGRSPTEDLAQRVEGFQGCLRQYLESGTTDL
jgi:hypothetical protein